VLGSDNGYAFTARRFKAKPAELGIAHRRGGYRGPESQAFIESWFGKLKQREVRLNEYETLDDAERGVGRHVDRYHQPPHSRLGSLACQPEPGARRTCRSPRATS
jgi:putative transposase